MTKVTIISGFLGAGKTTLIKKLIQGAMRGEKVILLENEYGEVGVDGGFARDAGITVTEINSGCICCTLSGDFEQAIDLLMKEYNPDRLVVEPSGVGKLSDIRRVVEKAKARHSIALTGCATVADAGRCRIYIKNFGEFFIDQIQSAETIFLSRTQLFPAERVEKSRALIAEQNPRARIVTTPWEELDAAAMLDIIENPQALLTLDDVDGECDDPDCECHHHDHDHDHDHHHHDHDHDHGHEHHHHGHDADEVFDNLGVETASRFTKEQLDAALSQLSDEAEYGDVIRAKGIVQAQDGGWLHFDYVPGEYSVRPGAADYTGRLCVIGVHLDEQALRALFGV